MMLKKSLQCLYLIIFLKFKTICFIKIKKRLYKSLEIQFSKDIDPVSLISIFTNQLILLDKSLYLNKKGLSYGTIASELGENPYVVMKNLNNFKNVDRSLIKDALKKLYDLDRSIKHSEINKYYGFELFLINF